MTSAALSSSSTKPADVAIEGQAPGDAHAEFRQDFIARLEKVVSPRPHGRAVVTEPQEMTVFETDALTMYRQMPWIVVLPRDTAEVSAVLKLCTEAGVPVVARGSGTGLSGGALPASDGVLMVMSRFDSILEVDEATLTARVQPGVTNLRISERVDHLGLFYAPDPSSQVICSIGGNVAENSGGVHSLKYGLTTNNVLGAELVLMDGTVITLGGPHGGQAGIDLLGVINGSEGLLAVVTEVTVKLVPKPEQVATIIVGFSSVRDAGMAVSSIIAAGIIPAGMEMMDGLTVAAVRDFAGVDYPKQLMV